MMKKLFLTTPLLFLSSLSAEIDFDRQVKPILNEKCTSCHGGVKRKGNISFLNREMALQKGKSGEFAILPGKPELSEAIHRIKTDDESDRMPPEGAPLSDEQIAILEQWVKEGAQWPQHWAYQAYDKPTPPKVEDKSWPKNAIDQFVLAKLEAKNIAPSQKAKKSALIRRLYIDLLGLIPTPQQVQAFENDTDPNAYEKLVDSLLQNSHFGERWGRHWLDKARYADTDGYEKDLPRPNAWRWRKWVIDAINADQPFDQFTKEQLAGDLFDNPSQDQILATAFHRQTMFNREGGVNPEEDRNKRVMDRISTVNTVWMGLTTACSQCHDHPYDPFTHKEFFEYMAFFNNSDEGDHVIKQPEYEAVMKKVRELRQLSSKTEKEETYSQAYQTWLKGEHKKKYSRNTQKLLDKGEKRNDKDNERLFRAYVNEVHPETSKWIKQAGNLEKTVAIKARIMKERNPKDRRKTYLYTRGDYLRPDKAAGELQASVMASLHPFKPQKADDANRLDLAQWIVDPQNPLTARVFVNSVWSHLFGAAFVEPMDDFGVRASRPEHLELLNYLAVDFVENGWSRKDLIRKILLSQAYQQTSAHRPELKESDPENILIARQNRFRVEAEIVRDMQLSCAELLKHKLGGQSVFPPVAIDVDAQSYGSFKWKVSQGDDRYRRGMYTFFKRTAPDPNLMVFDCPDASLTATQRGMSNTPLQALTTLNNEIFVEANQILAQRLLNMKGKSIDQKLDELFYICLARPSDGLEKTSLKSLLTESRQWYRQNPEEAKNMTEYVQNYQGDRTELAAWAATTRVVMNLDEFFTRE